MSHIERLTNVLLNKKFGIRVYFDNDFVFGYEIFAPVNRDGFAVMTKVGFAVFAAANTDTFQFIYGKFNEHEFETIKTSRARALNALIGVIAESMVEA